LVYVFIIPVLSIWVVDFGKDTPYYLFMLLFICGLADISDSYDKGNNVPLYKFVLLIISGLGASWSRNNGSMMIIVTMIISAVLFKRLRVRFLLSCLICIAFISGFELFMDSHYNVEPSPVGESYSVPLQTYVSYIREYTDELSEEETDMISELFSLEPGELAHEYDPMSSDPVKKHFIMQPSDEQMKLFWKCYKKAFFDHPMVFIRGFLRHTYGYFYPGQDCYLNRIAVYSSDFFTEYFSFRYLWVASPLRGALIYYSEWVYKLPVINYIYRPAVQMLIMISLSAFVLSGKKKSFISVFIPSILMVFVIFSPVNAYFRYMLPVFVALPINLACALRSADICVKYRLKKE